MSDRSTALSQKFNLRLIIVGARARNFDFYRNEFLFIVLYPRSCNHRFFLRVFYVHRSLGA